MGGVVLNDGGRKREIGSRNIGGEGGIGNKGGMEEASPIGGEEERGGFYKDG